MYYPPLSRPNLPRTPPSTENQHINEGSDRMGVYAIKPRFQRTLRPLEDVLVARQVHPDVITLSALGISVAAGATFAFADRLPAVLLAAPVVALGRTALNALDGLVAKRTGKARPWGEVLNEFSDRLADVALFGGLAVAGLAPVALSAAAIIAVLLASYLGTVSKAAGGPRQYGGVMGKADRMVLLGIVAPLALVFDPQIVGTALFATLLVGSLITLVQRGVKIHGDL
jgi:phosphatidylglycerophosphate synthase